MNILISESQFKRILITEQASVETEVLTKMIDIFAGGAEKKIWDVEVNGRKFTPVEIKNIIRKGPQNMSLEELNATKEVFDSIFKNNSFTITVSNSFKNLISTNKVGLEFVEYFIDNDLRRMTNNSQAVDYIEWDVKNSVKDENINKYNEKIKSIKVIPSAKFRGVKFYHGTVFDIAAKEELNPLFRQSEKYLEMRKKTEISSRHGSSDFGVGVYFGKNYNVIEPENAAGYSSPSLWNTYSAIYEMELKPNAKVAYYGNFQKLDFADYELLRNQGVDAVCIDPNGNGAINLINTNAISSWRIQSKLGIPFEVKLVEKNYKTEKWREIERKTFWDFAKYDDYVKSKLNTKESTNPRAGTYESNTDHKKNTFYYVNVARPQIKLN